ncbi:hypothetical protein HOLleu_20768 [Holothuria leucospilota]|uniref:Uncharacterized protein n=1 Tax=Holothuria leucospilota TaxID=206669 RepID=A0A9Q1C213_HOLLE|nr:hypothetical protein HOLleu_20768 [Holothuria leucospilota]
MASSSSAERQRRHRQRLKHEGKYEEYKIRHRDISRKSRQARKRKEMELPEEIRNELQEQRRIAVRRRVAKYRQQKREAELLRKASNQLKVQPTIGNELCRSLEKKEYSEEEDIPETTNHPRRWRRKQQYPQQFLPNEHPIAEDSCPKSTESPEWTEYLLAPKCTTSLLTR